MTIFLRAHLILRANDENHQRGCGLVWTACGLWGPCGGWLWGLRGLCGRFGRIGLRDPTGASPVMLSRSGSPSSCARRWIWLRNR